MIKYIKNWWENYRLNHHSCENHAKQIGIYPTSMEGDGWSVLTQQGIYRCTICNERVDID